MKTIKVSEVSGAALDWLVAKCEGLEIFISCGTVMRRYQTNAKQEPVFSPSANPAQAWPIIEREGINLRAIRKLGHAFDGQWLAMPAEFAGTGENVRWIKFLFGELDKRRRWQGETSLIAAMRCYVASKLGDTVEVPEELACQE